MKKLDPLLQPFVRHRMTGLALMNIHRNPNAAGHLLKFGGVEHLEDYFEFMEHLSQLFAPPSLPQPKKKKKKAEPRAIRDSQRIGLNSDSQRIVVNGGVTGGVSTLVRSGGAVVRRAQTGFLRYYAATLVLGLSLVLLYFLIES